MITSEESNNLQRVYHYFLENEQDSWTKVDDYMTYLEFLDVDQLIREVDTMLIKHGDGDPHCTNEHKLGESCIIDDILEAVELLTKEYDEGEPLFPEDEYVLKKYLAISQAGVIKF